MTLPELLKNSDFTAAELNVIKYIQEHFDEIPHMNIGDLAQRTFSSNSTIIRICRKLECKGFRELKHLIIKELESQKYLKQTVDFSEPVYSNQSTSKIVANMGTLYKEGIDIINANLDYLQLQEAVKIMAGARRIFIYCIGDTKTTARSFINKLLKLNYYPISATDNHEEINTAKNITSQDCVLFLSYSGKNIDNMNILPLIRCSKCRTIAITAAFDSRIAKTSNVCILLPDMEREAKVGTFYSQLAFTYILSILYSLLYQHTKH